MAWQSGRWEKQFSPWAWGLFQTCFLGPQGFRAHVCESLETRQVNTVAPCSGYRLGRIEEEVELSVCTTTAGTKEKTWGGRRGQWHCPWVQSREASGRRSKCYDIRDPGNDQWLNAVLHPRNGSICAELGVLPSRKGTFPRKEELSGPVGL